METILYISSLTYFGKTHQKTLFYRHVPYKKINKKRDIFLFLNINTNVKICIEIEKTF